MKRALLERMVAIQRAARAAVLVRDLTSGEQFLLDEAGDAPDGAPAAIVEEARLALRRDGASTLEHDGHRYLVQTLSPPYKLIVIGAVHIAQALIPMAQLAGFKVLLIDPRAAFASAERFPGVEVDNRWPQEALADVELTSRTAVVTLSHDAKIDEPALTAALRSESFYIGALGSRKNHAKRSERLAAAGFGEAEIARIAGPVGLPLGGRAPAEIAVSILAQIIQARYA
ncbi:MAG TPA: XdhC family protein [Gammaproteobacteria bacterium]